jgi:hypothetical protein|uniref:Uncharacterized protein n=1 Tax=Zea mays TaxID=4577 RepID=B4FVJ3_MAIZE|nr:unknown [Zea mays]ACG36073.1 hypothetical protein [Zea mays]
MDGHATAPDFSPAGSFGHATARSENSTDSEGGEPRATYSPPEKVSVDPPCPAIRLSCSERRTAVGVVLADPSSSFRGSAFKLRGSHTKPPSSLANSIRLTAAARPPVGLDCSVARGGSQHGIYLVLTDPGKPLFPVVPARIFCGLAM